MEHREAAGCLVAFCKTKNTPVRAVRERKELLEEFQNLIRSQELKQTGLIAKSNKPVEA
jgi:hypothetical protein